MAGSGARFERVVIVLAGVAALASSLISFVAIWLQTKNYRKPLLQRYVVRILLMVPIYSAASWASVESQTAAFYLDPLRDVYEAFTIYTFLQLLVNFLGGERSLIIMMHGRAPKSHPWPLNHCFAKMDISDPHTYLAIKRGILQYAYLKPILAVSTIVMKATGTYQEGYIGLSSGYLWSGILYNISITVSLYALAMFWVCMADDLAPFRPMPKFLCIKLIIFASYWQGFFLSILQFLGAIPNNVPGYSADNLAAAIQDALICFEMPLFAVAHWYAFSWHDYADVTISAARLPVKYALRDSFGFMDLIEDTKETWRGAQYDYRTYDSGDKIIAHEESNARVARMMQGMRYERGGKGKYWLPKSGEPNAKTPLLHNGGAQGEAPEARGHAHEYRAAEPDWEVALDPDDERLFDKARALEFGDWNYPVITAHFATREDWMNHDPGLLTTSTNRHLFQPTKDYKERRKSEIKKKIHKGKAGGPSSSSDHEDGHDIASKLKRDLSPSSSKNGKIDESLLVDLVVEDEEAEQMERVRARKEGGDAWNNQEQKHFVRTYSIGSASEGEDIREGYDPSKVPSDPSPPEHAVADDEQDEEADAEAQAGSSSDPKYGAPRGKYSDGDEHNPWSD